MNGSLRLPLNLATRPSRNRRLFRAVVGALTVLFLLLGGASALLLIRATHQRRDDLKASGELEIRIQQIDRERNQKNDLGKALENRDSNLVAEVNGAIARKNFSWVDFFSRLEKALPPDCLIAEINSLEMTGTSLRVVIKVATPGVPGLLTLIENLAAEKFLGVTMRNETAGGGRLISEIGFVYEGSH